MSATSLNRDRFQRMLDHGVSIVDEIRADAQRLAEKIQRINGGEYRVQVELDPGTEHIVITARRGGGR